MNNKPKPKTDDDIGLVADPKMREFITRFDSNFGLIRRTCLEEGISAQTYYNWKKRCPNFKKKIEKILKRDLIIVEDSLRERILAGDTQAIMFYLRTKGASRGWNEKEIIAKVLHKLEKKRKDIDSSDNRKFGDVLEIKYI